MFIYRYNLFASNVFYLEFCLFYFFSATEMIIVRLARGAIKSSRLARLADYVKVILWKCTLKSHAVVGIFSHSTVFGLFLAFHLQLNLPRYCLNWDWWLFLENFCHVWSLLRLIDFKIKNKFLSYDQCVISEENCLHCCGGGNAASYSRDAQRFSANCAKYIT